ncbi:MAG: hypothetical protein ABL893_11060, partial [Hyphomicrobium sp.]
RRDTADYGLAPETVAKNSKNGATPILTRPCIFTRFKFHEFSIPKFDIRLEPARSHVAVKRGLRPILDARGMTVFDRIVIAIGDMIAVITLIADVVLPISPLPDAALTLLLVDGT